jgi:hypothetical protein
MKLLNVILLPFFALASTGVMAAITPSLFVAFDDVSSAVPVSGWATLLTIALLSIFAWRKQTAIASRLAIVAITFSVIAITSTSNNPVFALVPTTVLNLTTSPSTLDDVVSGLYTVNNTTGRAVIIRSVLIARMRTDVISPIGTTCVVGLTLQTGATCTVNIVALP